MSFRMKNSENIKEDNSLEKKLRDIKSNIRYTKIASGALGAGSLCCFFNGYKLSEKQNSLEARQLVDTANNDYYKNSANANYMGGYLLLTFSLLLYIGCVFYKRKMIKKY